MIIKPTVIETIKDSHGIRSQLSVALKRHMGTVDRWVSQNIEDGPLTTAKALEVIKSETGLSDEQILQREHATAT